MADTAPAWGDLKQIETVGQLDNGSFGEGVKITFTTAAGAMGTIFVGRADYNAPNVKRLIDARVAVMNEISALHG